MSGKKGFSFIEILLILTVLGIIAAVALPRITESGVFDKYLIYTTAHNIAADMRLARRSAVTTGDSYRVGFGSSGGSDDYNEYGIQRYEDGAWTLVGEIKYIPDIIRVSGDVVVRFEPDGTANGNQRFIYRCGDYRYRITVRAVTGRVKLEMR